jgi:hypothetical protein
MTLAMRMNTPTEHYVERILKAGVRADGGAGVNWL